MAIRDQKWSTIPTCEASLATQPEPANIVERKSKH